MHVGLACSSLKRAEKFYGELLGLRRSEIKTVDRASAQTLFGQDKEMLYLSYYNESLRVELFILNQEALPLSPPAHVCFEVDGLEEFLSRCFSSGITAKTVERREKRIIFINDFDGNLFEIKEAGSGAKPEACAFGRNKLNSGRR